MKIAFVYDRVVKFGGAERILLSLHEIWPQAPLYTAVYDKKAASWAKVFQIKQTFLGNLPFAYKLQELSTFLTPYAFENFSFDDFDVVISISSQDAKSIITKPNSLHICYCLTPTRYLWSGFEEYYKQPAFGILNPIVRLGMLLFFPQLRLWDLSSSKRPDKYLAISNIVKHRVKSIYKLDSEVIYPPVDTDMFRPAVNKTLNNYFLIVSRLVPYKRIDYALRAFNRLNYKLKIIGSGIDENRLRKISGKNIEFIAGNLTDQKLCWYYQNCISLIFPGVEDFGLTPLEAQACGKPVIALNNGGATETVIHKKTGILYTHKTEKGLIDAVKKFKLLNLNPIDSRNNALGFSKQKFLKLFKNKIEKYYLNFKKNL